MGTPRHWAISGALADEYQARTGKDLVGTTQERLDTLDDAGLIVWRHGRPTPNADGSWQIPHGGFPCARVYVDKAKGLAVQDWWSDIPPVVPSSEEFQGFETQKPLALLRRIIAASTDPGDLVLDPYLGSGTTAVAAEALGRRWIGIEQHAPTAALVERRLGWPPNQLGG